MLRALQQLCGQHRGLLHLEGEVVRRRPETDRPGVPRVRPGDQAEAVYHEVSVVQLRRQVHQVRRGLPYLRRRPWVVPHIVRPKRVPAELEGDQPVPQHRHVPEEQEVTLGHRWALHLRRGTPPGSYRGPCREVARPHRGE